MHECQDIITRAGLAYRLAHEQLDADDAQYLIFMLEPIAGWYGISTICVEDVMDDLKDQYDNPPDQLLRYAEQATAHVGRKWDDSGETVGSARD